MLTPSYTEIMDVLNAEGDSETQVVTSRYSVVIAASKRARQIVSGAPFDAFGAKTDKAVSIAINELARGLIKLYPDGAPEPDPVSWEPEAAAEAQYKEFYGGFDDEDSLGDLHDPDDLDDFDGQGADDDSEDDEPEDPEDPEETEEAEQTEAEPVVDEVV